MSKASRQRPISTGQAEPKKVKSSLQPGPAAPSSTCDIKLEDCFRPIGYFCKVIGLLPLSHKGDCVSSINGCIVILTLGIYAAVSFQDLLRQKFTNAEEYAQKPGTFIFYSAGTFLYFYHHRYHGRLLCIFRKWNGLQLHFQRPDRALRRDANLIAAFVMLSAVLENAVNSIRYAQCELGPAFEERFGYNPRNESFLRLYSRSDAGAWLWEQLVSYHNSVALFAYICEKLSWYGLNASDCIVLILCRALCGKFASICHGGRAEISSIESTEDGTTWTKISLDHQSLWSLLVDIRDFASPLIFFSVGVSTYSTCMQVNFGLSTDSNATELDTVYAVWSVLHIWMRVFALCFAGSRILYWSRQVGELLATCPSPLMTLDVVRTERYICWNEKGLTGLGCFNVSTNLLLKMTGVILTYEIVILQAAIQQRPCKITENRDMF